MPSTSVKPTDTTPTRERKYQVMEIFGPTIQGEGIQAGFRTGFIRFGGCDYRCEKCDSLHAVIPEMVVRNSQRMTVDEIVAKCEELFHPATCDWITFSGGNPAMHDLASLVSILKSKGYKINVETQGSLRPEWLRAVDQITVSPKTPGMGETFEWAKFQKFFATYGNPICVKVVIFSAQDLVVAEQIDSWLFKSGQFTTEELDNVSLYLSLGNPKPPAFNEDNELLPSDLTADELLKDYRILIEEVLQNPHLKRWAFLPQIHVLTYGNQAGV